MTGDITRSTLEALAAVRQTPMSAYKLALVSSVHSVRAVKLLEIAADLGLVEVCGQTRKRSPIYRWKGG